jgi:hypothetical protein
MDLTALPTRPREVPRHRLAQAPVIVQDDEGHPLESTSLERAKGLVPCGKALAVADPDTEDFPKAIGAHARDDQYRTRNHTLFLPALDEQGFDHHEGILALWMPFVEGPDPRIQSGAQRALTVDLEKLAPHSFSLIAATLRGKTPCTTLFMSARPKACSLRS